MVKEVISEYMKLIVKRENGIMEGFLKAKNNLINNNNLNSNSKWQPEYLKRISECFKTSSYARTVIERLRPTLER
mgnify:CR=1 FL=1